MPQEHAILNAVIEARDWTHMDTCWVSYCWAIMGTPQWPNLIFKPCHCFSQCSESDETETRVPQSSDKPECCQHPRLFSLCPEGGTGYNTLVCLPLDCAMPGRYCDKDRKKDHYISCSFDCGYVEPRGTVFEKLDIPGSCASGNYFRVHSKTQYLWKFESVETNRLSVIRNGKFVGFVFVLFFCFFFFWGKIR